jgi:hypothetical protein
VERPPTDPEASASAPAPDDLAADGLLFVSESSTIDRMRRRDKPLLRRAFLAACLSLAVICGGGYLLTRATNHQVVLVLLVVMIGGLLAVPLFILGSVLFSRIGSRHPRRGIPLPDPLLENPGAPEADSLAARIRWDPPGIRGRGLVRPERSPQRRFWIALLGALLILGALLGGGGWFLYRTPIDPWGDKVEFSEHLQIYHGRGVSEEEATAVGRYVLAQGLGTPWHPVTLRLARAEDGYVLYVFTDSPATLIEGPALDEMRWFRDQITRDVFQSRPVKLLVCETLVGRGAFGQLAEPNVIKTLD